MKKRYAFSFNNKESIVIKSSVAWNKLAILEDIQIMFQMKRSIKLVLGHGAAVGILQNVVDRLENTIQNKGVLSDQCICKGNLGLYAVKDFAACILNQNSDKNVLQECPHQFYRLCAAKKRIAWLYNNQCGNIILEITPWLEVTVFTKQQKYEQWLTQYRPILKRIIAVQAAHELVQKIKSLLRVVRINANLTPDFK